MPTVITFAQKLSGAGRKRIPNALAVTPFRARLEVKGEKQGVKGEK
jgi:hypothetical protein